MTRATISFGNGNSLHLEPASFMAIRVTCTGPAGRVVWCDELDRERAHQFVAAMLVFMEKLWPLAELQALDMHDDQDDTRPGGTGRDDFR